MKPYTFGVIPPVALLEGNNPLTENQKLGTIRITNTGTDTNINISGITLQFASHTTATGGIHFNSSICLRDAGSTASCGQGGTTIAQNTDENG